MTKAKVNPAHTKVMEDSRLRRLAILEMIERGPITTKEIVAVNGGDEPQARADMAALAKLALVHSVTDKSAASKANGGTCRNLYHSGPGPDKHDESNRRFTTKWIPDAPAMFELMAMFYGRAAV